MYQWFMHFGEELKAQRERAGLGIREICRMVNYDPSNWSKIEKDKIAPPGDIETLKIWAKALNININSQEFQDFIHGAAIARGVGVGRVLPYFSGLTKNVIQKELKKKTNHKNKIKKFDELNHEWQWMPLPQNKAKKTSKNNKI